MEYSGQVLEYMAYIRLYVSDKHSLVIYGMQHISLQHMEATF
jgi:hypothetical protein